MKTFSIVVPVYQNEGNLPETIPALLELRAKLPDYRLELLLIDDGSTDRSRELILAAAQDHPRNVRGILLTKNFGQTAAIQAGLRHASGDCIGIISCDLQEPHLLFLEMVKAWEQGGLFVLGERRGRAEGRFHKFASGIYWNLVRRFAFRDFPSMGYDFCLIDRQVAADVNRIDEKNSSIFVLIYWLGYRPHRIPIRRELRSQGKSQWGFWSKVGFTADTLIGFTYFPARLITFLGLISAASCLAYLVYALVLWFAWHAAPKGWVTLAGLVLLIGAAVLFSLGIISEYLLRILDEARRRPPYVVEKATGKAEPERSRGE